MLDTLETPLFEQALPHSCCTRMGGGLPACHKQVCMPQTGGGLRMRGWKLRSRVKATVHAAGCASRQGVSLVAHVSA